MIFKRQITPLQMRILKIACLLLMTLLALAYSPKPPQTQLEQVLNEGVLRVGVRLGALSYYERDDEPDGLDYNILNSFAESLGVRLEIELFEELSDQLAALETKDSIHIAAATLSVTEERLNAYQFSRPYMEVDTVLIQHTSKARYTEIQKVIDEQRQIVAISGSAHTEILRKFQREHPDLEWQEESETIMFQLMERVQNQELDMAVIDSSIFDLEASLFPNVEVALTLQRSEPIAFAFPQRRDNSVLDAMDEFLDQYEAQGTLDDLLATYLDPEPSIDIAGSMLFNERIQERLPIYEKHFRSVADEYDYSWVLLAAQAYQESHWNATARSPTGVRGLMMLTLPTARQLGIESRLDPIQSLEGGMRYLAGLKKRLPDRIQEPDRNKFALAAYNVGYGHLEDARILTQRGGDNPDSWADVQKYLPLLRQRKYFSTVKYGFARGTEPVYYVNTIYRYANILEWYDWQQEMSEDLMVVEAVSDPEELIEDNSLNDILEFSPAAL